MKKKLILLLTAFFLLAGFNFILNARMASIVTFDGKRAGGISGDGLAKIYVNGGAEGTERTLTSGYVTYSEDIAVTIGDAVQVYIRTDGDRDVFIRNFRMKNDVQTEMDVSI